ncbi:MAG TPA: shikimate dehydrogenase [Jatrophihabitans sp.]|uniref:shikimate dehydrogenase n=1 Tax=Jatrophihabitans sp. TaxID=1932789 RepID=UPI002F02882F
MPPRSAAVLGKPIGHSLSPVLHRAAYGALGLTGWSYTAIECDEQGLAALLAGSDEQVVGYSCTMPLKRQVLRVANSASPEAVAIGAGNTLLRRDAGWHADNTDWIGIRDALAAASLPTGGAVTIPRAGGAVTILGAGGTAQAALAALAELSEPQVTVLVREPSRAGPLLDSAQRLGLPVRLAPLSERRHWLEADLIIATLPAGAADRFAGLPFRRDQALLEAVYHPWPTPLAAALTAAGAPVVSGAAMLLHQAARQVELMTGSAAPVEAMRAALLAAVPGCAA